MFSASIDMSDYLQMVGRTLDVLQEGIERSVEHTAREAEREARSSGRFKDRTGELRRGLAVRLLNAGHLSTSWELVSPAKYSRFIEEGTSAHDIYPKAGHGFKGPLPKGQSRRATGKGPHEQIVGRGRALRWKDDGGDQHFAPVVHHPGTQPDPFMGRAYYHAERVLYRNMADVMRRIEGLWV